MGTDSLEETEFLLHLLLLPLAEGVELGAGEAQSAPELRVGDVVLQMGLVQLCGKQGFGAALQISYSHHNTIRWTVCYFLS